MQRLIAAADVEVGWEDKNIRVRVPGGGPYVCSRPELLLLLNDFAQNPMTPETALGQLKGRIGDDAAGGVEQWGGAMIDALRAQKILVPYRLSHGDFFEILNRKRKGMDFLKYDDWGMTVSNCGKENLSPGCQSCKEGGWICVFPGFTCNAQCKFCPRLTENMVQKPLMNQVNLDLLLMAIDAHKEKISGVSVSGGELFFSNYGIARELVRRVAADYPHIYLWGYTNGIAATADNMKEMRDLGLQELRFNLAATDFDPAVIDKIRNHAVRIFPWVTVEVPIYGESFGHLVGEEKLKALCDMGVRQLNLAEIRVPSPGETDERDISPAARHFLDQEELYQFDYMSVKVLSVVKSRLYTYDIFDYVSRHNLDIRVNDCSQEAKFVQIAGRTSRGLNKISSDVDAFADF